MSKLLGSPSFLKRKETKINNEISRSNSVESVDQTQNSLLKLPPAFSQTDSIANLPISKLKSPSFLDSKKLNSLHFAVHSSDLRKLKTLLFDKKHDVNKRDSYHGFTALHLAVEESKYDIAALLLNPLSAHPDSAAKAFLDSDKKTVDINIVNRDGRTALTLAVIRGCIDIVSLVIKHGAELNIQDQLGCAAIHYAIYLGDISAFRLLVDHGAKLDLLDNSGLPLFFHAINCKRPEMANHFIKHTPQHLLNAPYGPDQSTALHKACENSMSSSIQTLVEMGANPTALDKDKRKPIDKIDFDFERDHEVVVQLLASREVSISAGSIGESSDNSKGQTTTKASGLPVPTKFHNARGKIILGGASKRVISETSESNETMAPSQSLEQIQQQQQQQQAQKQTQQQSSSELHSLQQQLESYKSEILHLKQTHDLQTIQLQSQLAVQSLEIQTLLSDNESTKSIHESEKSVLTEKINSLNTQIEQMNTQIQRFELDIMVRASNMVKEAEELKQLDFLKRHVKEKEQEVANLERGNAKLKFQVTSMEKQLQLRLEENGKANDKTSENVAQLATLGNDKSRLESLILDMQVRETELQVSHVASLGVLKCRIKELEAEVDRKQLELLEAQRDQTEFADAFQKAVARYLSAEASVKELKQQNASLVHQNSTTDAVGIAPSNELELKYSNLSNQLQEANSRCTTTEENLSDTLVQLQNQTMLLQEKEQTIVILKSDIDQLQKQARNLHSKAFDLSLLLDVEKTTSSKKSERTRLLEEAFKEIVEKLQLQLNESLAETLELQNQIRHLLLENSSLTQRLRESSEDLANEVMTTNMLSLEKKELVQKVESQERKLKQVGDEVDGLLNHVQRLEMQLQKSEDSNQQLQNENSGYKAKSMQSTMEVAKLTNEIQVISKMLRVAEAAVATLNGQHEASQVLKQHNDSTIENKARYLQQELTASNAAIQKLLTESMIKRVNLSSEITHLQSQLHENLATINSLHQTIQEEQEEKELLIKKTSHLKVKLEENSLLKAGQGLSVVNELQSQLSKEREKVKRLSVELNLANEKMEQLESSISQLEESLQSEVKRNVVLNAKLMKEKQTVHELKDNIDVLTTQYLNVSSDYVTAQNRVNEEEDLNESLKRNDILQGFEINEKLEQLLNEIAM
ncbi:UNVERIFIED_CONTAM: hypothetical protein HDU68_009381 [Siphonaria sp. JEL0065]|nr:hypothetical protein HDU68_009381 [Siphonaria sp. JEL0065]